MCTEYPSLLNKTGDWNFECIDGNFSGKVSVVPGLHIISVTASIPHDCYAVGIGDVVLWLDADNNHQNCQKNVIVESDSNDRLTLNLTGNAT